MNKEGIYTDEFIDAYLMGELSESDRARFLEDLRNNEPLRKHLAELEDTRKWVAFAYENIDSTLAKTNKPGAQFFERSKALVAGIFLILGLSLGALLSQYSNPNPIPATEQPWRIVLHVNSNDPYLQNTLLDETQHLLKEFRQKKKKLQVEIVVYGKGVSLVQVNSSPHIKRILALQKTYSNLAIEVCGRTLQRMRQKKVTINLIPNAHIAPSGIRQIIKRQKEGWNYIRI